MSKLYEQIYKRKSVRNYNKKLLDDATKEKIYEAIKSLKLYNGENCTLDLKVSSYEDFVNTKRLNFITRKMVIKSPYYISIFRNNTDDAYINAGYCGEELVLKLKEIGLDTCWVGASKVYDRGQEFIVGIAFGYSDIDSKIIRKRADIEDYYKGNTDYIDVVKAVREAPSAKNSQPARLKFSDNKIVLYNRNKNDLILKDLNIIDMGIALRHLTLALEEYNLDYRIKKVAKEFIIEVLNES